MDEKPLLHIINCESAKDMWKKLESVYEQKSDTSVHAIAAIVQLPEGTKQ